MSRFNLVALFVLALVARPLAASEDTLTLPIGVGGSVASVLNENAERIRAFVPRDGEWRNLDAKQLVRALLDNSIADLPHGVHTGNIVRVSRNGMLEVQAGTGPEPQPFANNEQLHKLLRELPETALRVQLLEWTHRGSITVHPFSVSEDGRAITVAGTTYRAAPGITFSGRDNHFHVIGKIGPLGFTHTVWPFAEKPFAFPSNPYYEQTSDNLVQPKRTTDTRLAQLLADGELYSDDNHYHITRTYGFEAWQNIVRLANDPAASDDVRKLASVAQVALLLKEYFIDLKNAATDLAAINAQIARVWQGFDQRRPGPQLSFIVRYNAAMDPEGKKLEVGNQVLTAGDSIHLDFCKHHVHVRDDMGLGIDVVADPPANAKARVRIPANVFVEQRGDHIELRELPRDIRRLLESDQLKAHDGTYRITMSFHEEAFRAIKRVLDRKDVPRERRKAIRAEMQRLLSAAVPTHSEQAMTQAIESLGREVEKLRKSLPALPPPPPPGQEASEPAPDPLPPEPPPPAEPATEWDL